MTPVIPQGLTGRVCPKSLGSCGQPSSSGEAVVGAVTQWLYRVEMLRWWLGCQQPPPPSAHRAQGVNASPTAVLVPICSATRAT